MTNFLFGSNPGGESNTASNIGVGGVGLFKQKVGVDLRFKNINVASNKLSVVDDATNSEVDLDVVEANLALNNIGGTLGTAKGGTNLTSYATGDLLYASAANTLSKLAGNTTTSKKFLIQTGTGSASQAPGWDFFAAVHPGMNTVAAYYGTYLGHNIDVVAVVPDRLYAFPMAVPATYTFDLIGIEVTTAGGAGENARLGIYDTDGNGLPASLLLDAGTVPVSSTGEKTISISQTLNAGWYWLTMVSDSATAILTGDYYDLGALLGYTSMSDYQTNGFYRSFTYGSLPASFGTPSLLQELLAPRIVLSRAA